MAMTFLPRILLLSTLALSAGVGQALGSVTPALGTSGGHATKANIPAHVHSPAKPPADTAQTAAKETSTMNTAQVGSQVKPTLSAEEVGLRFLKLVERLEHRDDLTLALVKEVTGLELAMTPWDKRHFVSEGPVASNWIYVVGFIDAPPPIGKRTYLDFRNSTARFAEMSDVCAHDFNYWHDAFLAMGFDATEIRGEIGQLESWRYYKNDFAFYIVPQNVVPGERGRLCVTSIRMMS